MPIWLIVCIIAAYVAVLFIVAWAADRPGRNGAAKPSWATGLGYALALTVYCTSWTYFGAVGTAAASGWDYVWIYAGPVLVMVFWASLLRRIGDVAQRESVSTLSDFLGARYGKSRAIAALATIAAVTGSLPYIALQLKSVGLSLGALVGIQSNDTVLTNNLVLGTAIAMSVFAVLFGARQSDATRRNPGLMRVLQFEAVFKLVALMAVCALSLVMLANSEVDLIDSARIMLSQSDGGFRPITILLLSMAAIICLPRQFHIAMIERQNAADVEWARWTFSLYLILTSAIVIPIAVAGLALLPSSTSPDLFVLQLPLQVGEDGLAVIAFLGGFAAATGMIVVATIALSAMVTNDLIVPLLLDRRRRSAEPGTGRRTLLRIRRSVIFILLALAYGVYLLGAGSAALAQIGLLSFAAAAQFGPALIGAVLWRRANRRGALVGLSTGFVVWLYTLFLPSLLGADTMAETMPDWLNPHALLGVSFGDSLTHGTIWSLGLNAALFFGLSLTARERLRDRVQAVVFTADAEPRIAAQGAGAPQTVGISPDGLAALAARFLDEDAVRHAFDDFALNAPTVRIDGAGNADWQLVQFTEKLLARAIGASSSRVIMASALSDHDINFDDVLTLFDQRGLSERFDDHFLQSTLEVIPQGLSVVDSEQRLVAWNGAYVSMFDYPNDLLRRGTPIAKLIEHNIATGWIKGGNPTEQAARRVEHMRAGKPHSYERANPDGRFFRIEGSPTPGGGYVTTFTDVTRDRQREQALADANDTLEMRVQQRTQELEDMADTLQRARDDADAANASKTRFLAAASHDLLQPLNAARLFIGAIDPDRPGPVLLAKADHSIAAADTLLSGLLDVSKLDHGTVKLDLRDISLGALFLDLIDEAAPMAEDAGLSLRHVPTRLHVRADADFLHSVLRNLLSNARRYTATGGVLIGARRTGDQVRIEVWDTGPGIAEARQDAIFEEFERLGIADNRGERGSGLGLSVARRMARLMGTDIAVRSVVGSGSVFSITLPRAASGRDYSKRSQPKTLASSFALTGQQLWVVDDEAPVRDAMAELIRRWGGSPRIFNTAEALLEALRTNRPDAVLADHDLGQGLTGLALIERLRALTPDCPAVLITATRSNESRSDADNLGIEIVHKPVDPVLLQDWLKRQLRL